MKSLENNNILDKAKSISVNKAQCSSSLLIMLTAIVGVMIILWTVQGADREMREKLLGEAHVAAEAVNIERIQALSGTKADLESPDYLRIKKQFAAMRAANPKCRFVYLMGRKADGTVYFFADSEPVGSEDESPAGQVYEEVSADYLRAFETKTALVAGPVTDRWGTWFSALIPLTNPQTGDLIAVLGMDIDASNWKWDVIGRTALSGGGLLALLCFIVGAILLFSSAGDASADRRAVGLRAGVQIAVIVVIMIFLMVLMTVSATSRIDREAVASRKVRNAAILAKKSNNVQQAFADLEQQLEVLSEIVAGRSVRDPYVKKQLKRAYQRSKPLSYAAYRIDRSGRIASMFPIDEKSLGADISGQAHMQEIVASQKPVVSNGFMAEEGFPAVTIHVPVIVEGDYDGTVAFLIDLDCFAQRFIKFKGKLFDQLYLIDAQDSILFSSNPELLMQQVEQITSLENQDGLMKIQEPLQLHGKRWRFIDFEDTQALLSESANARRNIWTILFGGIATILFAGILLYFLLIRSLQNVIKARTRQLSESKGRFDQLAEQSRTFTWEIDANGLYTYVGHTVATVLGYEPEELVGKKHFYDLHPEEGRDAFKASAPATFARKESFDEFENQIETKTGEILWVDTYGIPLLDPDGTLRGYRGQDTDITKRKRAEEELQSTLADTERMNRLMSEREDRVLELKDEVNVLRAELNREAKYGGSDT